MSTEINTSITADLHPDTFRSQVGADDDTAPFIAPAVEAFESAYSYLGSIYAVREAAFSDPTLTPEAALLRTDDHAAAKLAAVTQKFDSTIAQFTRSIKSLEADLSASVKEQAGKMVSGEVRALMQKSSDRVALLEKALAEKDEEVLSAVLGAPPMLSGLSKELHATFLRAYNQMRKPETTKRLNALTAARTQLENKGGLVLREMEKAVGTVPVLKQDKAGVTRIVGKITPREVREKRNASAKVYRQHA
ncbi:hypothetical protein J3R80_10050 [Aliiroseovarius sp. Z3]|uniref:hypothetical protein n=1 Tax=Aliiroseovarius sp. Z3 TaxID=2811402 RepID=UPI0023B2B045|nr:hypothetical protein [Aliiroseovarius sp. Z3]MDE9450806.1 hypothetical protein [Aliiroseovarius sp. Z3]